MKAKDGKEKLYWEPRAGVEIGTDIPARFLSTKVMKRPAASIKGKKEAEKEHEDKEEANDEEEMKMTMRERKRKRP